MPKSPFQEWLSVLEYKQSRLVFLAEWMALFGVAWFFWSLMFTSLPGAVPPGLAATLIAVLYATSILYGRVLKVTGCSKCHSALPFLRNETGRRHLPDHEQCVEIQYGGEEWGQEMIQIYSRVCRTDIVTYQCRSCEKVWEEKIELAGSGYRLVRRFDPKDVGLSMRLVDEGVLTLTGLIRKTAFNPAYILGLSKGTLRPGSDADVVLIDREKE